MCCKKIIIICVFISQLGKSLATFDSNYLRAADPLSCISVDERNKRITIRENCYDAAEADYRIAEIITRTTTTTTRVTETITLTSETTTEPAETPTEPPMPETTTQPAETPTEPPEPTTSETTSDPTTEPPSPTTVSASSTTVPASPTTEPPSPTTVSASSTTEPASPTTEPPSPTTVSASPTTELASPTTEPPSPTTEPASPTTEPPSPTTVSASPTTVPAETTTVPTEPPLKTSTTEETSAEPRSEATTEPTEPPLEPSTTEETTSTVTALVIAGFYDFNDYDTIVGLDTEDSVERTIQSLSLDVAPQQSNPIMPTIINIQPNTSVFQLIDWDNETYLQVNQILDFENASNYNITLSHEQQFVSFTVLVEDVRLQICQNVSMTSCSSEMFYTATISESSTDPYLTLDGSSAIFVQDLDSDPFVDYEAQIEDESILPFHTFSLDPPGPRWNETGYRLRITNSSLLFLLSDQEIFNVTIFQANQRMATAEISLTVTRSTTSETTTEPPSESTTATEPTLETSTTEDVTTLATTTLRTTTTRRTTLPTVPGCRKCQETEFNGYLWSACAGQVAVRDCSDVNPSSSGQIEWACTENGFLTRQPDYSKCVSKWLEDIKEDQKNVTDADSAVNYLEKLEDAITSDKNESNSNFFGHEILQVTNILSNVIQTASNSTPQPDRFLPVASKTVGLTQHIISTQEPWYHLDLANRSQYATNLLNTIEETSFLLTGKVNVSLRQNVPTFFQRPLIAEDQFLVVSFAGSKVNEEFDDFEFPPKSSLYSKDSLVKLPPGWKQGFLDDKIECLGMFMDAEYASLMMPGQYNKLGLNSTEETKKIMNGKMMAFTVSAGNQTDLKFSGQGVQIVFKHELASWGSELYSVPRKLHPGEIPKAALGTAQCVYWDTYNLIWSTEGCKVVSSSKSETTCECSHLTSFAILMDVHNYTGKNFGLEVLTLVLCTISNICLIVTIFIFLTIRMARSERTSITLNLAVCLLIGNFLVILVLDRNYFHMSEGFCIASAIVTHYVFLAAFGWMFVQGVHLYNMVINIFKQVKSPLIMYRVSAYGMPFICIFITTMAGYLEGHDPYGGEVVCWLNDQYIWGFMGPVLIIVLANLVILSVSLLRSYRVRTVSTSSSSHRRVSSLRVWIQGCFGLTILLGITWLTGFFMLAPEIPGLVAAYFFTVFNASQGIFIFVFHCIFNEKVRHGIHRQHSDHLPSWFSEWLKTTPPTSTDPSSQNNKTPAKRKLSTSESSLPSEMQPKPMSPENFQKSEAQQLEDFDKTVPDFLPPIPPRRNASLKHRESTSSRDLGYDVPKPSRNVVLQPENDDAGVRTSSTLC